MASRTGAGADGGGLAIDPSTKADRAGL